MFNLFIVDEPFMTSSQAATKKNTAHIICIMLGSFFFLSFLDVYIHIFCIFN